MRIVSLQSGSNGNCVFVETKKVRLLFDAGLTGSKTQERLAEIGVDVRSITAVLISHDHSDHIAGAGVLHRQFGLPLWMTRGTYQQAVHRKRLGRISEPHLFQAGTKLSIGSVQIETLPTMHDAAEGVCFVVDDGAARLGIMTDLGCPFLELSQVMATLDAVLLESNYDATMLENGPYPEELKKRIRGQQGHISNHEAAQLIHGMGKKLRWACLGHLSADNNRPEIALETHRRILGNRLPLYVASRSESCALPEL